VIKMVAEIKKIPKYILDEKKIFNGKVELYKKNCAKLLKERQNLIAMREKLEKDCEKHGFIFSFKL